MENLPQLVPAEELRSFFRENYSTPGSSTNLLLASQQLPKVTFSPCTAPFDKLERVEISQLRVSAPNSGKYVLVRCLEDGGCVQSGWHTVVEDQVGDACVLSLFFFPPKQLSISPGTALVIKEPRLFSVERRSCSLRFHTINCVSISDILVLRPSHHLFGLTLSISWVNECEEDPLPRSVQKWTKRGDKLRSANLHMLAREAYFSALQLCKNKDKRVKNQLTVNLVQQNLELKCYEKAIELGEILVETIPGEKIAYLLLGEAYYAVRKYEDALKTLNKFFKKDKNIYDKEGLERILRASARIKEGEGKFKIANLELKERENPHKCIEWADYDGLTEIKEVPGERKCLVSKEDAKKGEIMMVSKAYCAVLLTPDKLQKLECITDAMNPNENLTRDQVLEIYQSLVFVALVSRICKNPATFGPLVFDLPSHPTLANEAYRMFCDTEFREPMCDGGKLRAICRLNCLEMRSRADGGLLGAGLFVRPALARHNCQPNLDCEFYGDVMVAKARTDLAAGTHLTICYMDETWDYEKRAAFLKNRHEELECDCNRCKNRA